MSKTNLTEATMLALQGKLQLEESKEVIEEDVNVSVQDDYTEIDTDDSIITILDKDAQVIEDIDLSTIDDDFVVVPVESEETIIPEDEVPEETVEEIVDEEPVEEPVEEPTVDEIVEGEIEESKEIKTEEVEEAGINVEMTDDEIAKYIATNFEKITGIDIDTIYNNEDSKEIFNQTVIDQSSPAILKVLADANIEGKRLEEVLYKLDDELASIRDTGKTTESKEVVEEDKELKTEEIEIKVDNEEGTPEQTTVEVTTTEGESVEVEEQPIETEGEEEETEVEEPAEEELEEASAELNIGANVDVPDSVVDTAAGLLLASEEDEKGKKEESKEKVEEDVDARPHETALISYFDGLGYLDGAEGNVIMALLGYLSDDDVKRFAQINEYPIFDEDGNVIKAESKEIKTEELTDKQIDVAMKLEDPDSFIKGANFIVEKEEDIKALVDEYKDTEAYTFWKAFLDLIPNLKKFLEESDDSGETKFEGKEESDVCPHCGKEKCVCSKELKYNTKTFNEVLSKYFADKYKAVESFEITKLLKSDEGLKLEGKLIDTKNESKEITLEFTKLQEGTSYTKYKMKESTGLLKESKSKEVTLMTKVTENTLDCRYVTEK